MEKGSGLDRDIGSLAIHVSPCCARPLKEGNVKGKRWAALAVFAMVVALLPLSAVPAAAGSGPSVFINELHYDNASTDTGEAVEVAGPAGTDLTGWSIALYNGSATQLKVYDTITLSGVIPDQESGYGTLAFPRAGIQNGSPDGLALVDASDAVVQFLSYEGSFTAASGPANGMTSTDIGVSESGSDPVGYSLQLTGTGTSYGDFTWAAPMASTFGAVNTGQTFGGGSPTVLPFINELHYDNTGTDTGEAIEVAGPAGTDLTGWSIVLYNGNGGAPYGSTVSLSGTLADAGDGYGFVVVNYPSNGIQNGSPDGIALVDASDAVVQFLSYEGSFTAVGGPADGMTSTDIGATEDGSTAVGDSLQLQGTGTTYDDFTWGGPIPNTFGAVNTGQTFGEITDFPVEVSCEDIATEIGTATSAGVSASDADGTVTQMSLSVDPEATGITLTSFSPADTTGGEATAEISVGADVPAGHYSATVTAENNDDPVQTGTCDLTIVVHPLVTNSIYELQYTTEADGSSTFVGQTVVTEGVVTAVFGNNAFIQDGTGPWTGIYLYGSSGTLSIGDVVHVEGDVSEYYGLTEIGVSDVWVVGSATVPAPALLTTGEIGQEQWESVFVAAQNVTVANEDLGYGEWSVDDGSGSIVIDDIGSYSYDPTNGDNIAFIQGPLNYTYSAFKIAPRFNNDIVVSVMPIGEVQGSVGDTDNGATFTSPYEGQPVVVRAVITEQILARTSSGYDSWGYFLQNTLATADSDPNSSDGVYLYTGKYDDIYYNGSYYVPQVGDELILRGTVSEYYDLTELSGLSILAVVRHGVDLDTEVPAVVANPPNNLDDAHRYWERLEGMRVEVPAGSTTLSPRNVFASTLDGEVWLAAPGSEISGLSGYEARAFRDGRNVADFEGNGFRIVLGSLGIKATAGDNTALIAPVRTFDTITEPVVGAVYYSYSKYQIQVVDQLSFSENLDPSHNYPPQAQDLASEYSVTTFNMENLYDYRDDPFSGCDFLGNSGCDDVYPPFDYVPASASDYETRVGEIAAQIVNNLHSPDIVLAQEIENQDICSIEDWTMVCGDVNNVDGRPDALEDLAIAIHDLGGPSYDSAFDRDGGDDRGITAAFLFRSDRVELLPAEADNPVLGDNPTVDYPDGLAYNYEVSNPKALNADLPAWVDTSTGTDGDLVFTRAPQVGYFRIWQNGIGSSAFTDLYAISNHFSSGPDRRVGQRTEQAAYNAAIVAALEAYDPNVRVVVGGDLNVYPDSGQLVPLYDQGLENLYYTLLGELPFSAYSYVYEGQAQTLDQLFVTPSILSDLDEMRAAHINSDFPADYVGDGARGTSDHDPQVATFKITVLQIENLVMYYADMGMITGNKTEKILLDRLERARRYLENGKTAAYEAQLQAFSNQVQGFAPKFIDQDAADILSYYAWLLMNQ